MHLPTNKTKDRRSERTLESLECPCSFDWDDGNAAPALYRRPAIYCCGATYLLLVNLVLAAFGNPDAAGLSIGDMHDLEATVFWCTIKRNSTPMGPNKKVDMEHINTSTVSEQTAQPFRDFSVDFRYSSGAQQST
jgi:hypothetical protein